MFNENFWLHPQYAYPLLGLFSLIVGSLLNAIIYRLPLMLQAQWRADCLETLDLPAEEKPLLNLWWPRSFCPNCKNMIHAWQNIPLLSYCGLRGKCAHCRQTIPFSYPLVELLSCMLSLLAAFLFGFNLTLIFALLFIWMMLCMSLIDIHHHILPDSLTLGLLWTGLIANTLALYTTLPNAVLSAAGAYLVLWVFIQIFYLITGKIGMGHGDFKLYAAFGAWFGWIQLPVILLMASFIGAVFGLTYLKITKQSRETPIPFGPFLCLSGLIALFWGQAIIDWYLHLF